MRVATGNVNAIRQRIPRLLAWLDRRRPEIVCLQETKLPDEAFHDLLDDEMQARGYAAAVHGEAGWNGGAILSRVGIDDVAFGVPGAPGVPGPESRALAATLAGIRGASGYGAHRRIP